MADKSKHKNRASKLKGLAEKGKGELVTPDLDKAKLPLPGDLETVGDIRNEMRRVYKMVFEGKVLLSDATRLAYYLDKMIQAIKTETELNTLAAAYSKAWGGVTILTDIEEMN